MGWVCVCVWFAHTELVFSAYVSILGLALRVPWHFGMAGVVHSASLRRLHLVDLSSFTSILCWQYPFWRRVWWLFVTVGRLRRYPRLYDCFFGYR